MEIATMPVSTLFPLEGGIMMAMNIPYNATLKALITRSGRIFPENR